MHVTALKRKWKSMLNDNFTEVTPRLRYKYI